MIEDVSVVIGAAGAGDGLPGVLGEHPAHEDEGGRQDDGDEDPHAVDEHPGQQQKPDLGPELIMSSEVYLDLVYSDVADTSSLAPTARAMSARKRIPSVPRVELPA